MKKYLPLLFLSFLFLQNCSFLEQSDFNETKIISNDLNEKIIYQYYQIGKDHYKVDFYSIHQSDSIKLFEHSINKSLLTTNTYKISEYENEVVISTKLFRDVRQLVTKNGKLITLTNR